MSEFTVTAKASMDYDTDHITPEHAEEDLIELIKMGEVRLETENTHEYEEDAGRLG